MIYNMDAMDFLARVPAGKYKTMFADPPDNLGLDYGDGGAGDRVPAAHYYAWLECLILRAMLKCKVLVLSYYHRHDLKVASMLDWVLTQRHPSWTWQKVIWRFTFGQYVKDGISSGYRPILILSAPGAVLHYDAIKVMSARELMGDKRAAVGGLRTPDDVWDIPRVTGNSAERRAWHPTQHPEELMSRIARLCGHPLVDLFGGTGTSIRADKRVDCVELNPDYARRIGEENKVEVVTDLHAR